MSIAAVAQSRLLSRKPLRSTAAIVILVAAVELHLRPGGGARKNTGAKFRLPERAGVKNKKARLSRAFDQFFLRSPYFASLAI